MADLSRCPFCENAIPREALYCARCGGKLPRPQATAPGLAPQSPTPAGDRGRPPAEAAPASASTGGATGGGSVAPGNGSRPSQSMPAPSPSSAGSSGFGDSAVSQSLSISRIQRPARGAKIALVVGGAALCIAGGWLAGRWYRPEPIAAVAAPAIVELGQPRVALGADLPDPARFLDPGVDGGAVSQGGRGPVRVRTTPGPATRPDPQNGRPSAPDGGPPAPVGPAPANTADGGAPTPASSGNGEPANAGGESGQEGEGEDPGAPEGQLDTRAVIYVVRHYLPQVRACYERQLRNEPELRGQITMRFTVGAGGRVVDTSVVVNSTGSDALAACVSSNLRTWRFPVPEGGAVSFEYPFRFGSPAALPQLPGATQDP